MKILIAIDKFKGALDSPSAVSLASQTIEEVSPSALCWSVPLTDGGEGFARIIGKELGGELLICKVPGPRFHPVNAKLALVPWRKIPQAALDALALPQSSRGKPVGFVEMASSSGYESLTDEERDPWQTTSYGTGVLMREAAKRDAGAVVIGLGGSATNDCGAGALEALGVLYYDRELQPIQGVIPAKFPLIHTLGGTSHLRNAFPPVRIANDVVNPLLGPNGATCVFGPQKGLRPDDSDRMERNIKNMGTRLLGLFGKDPDRWDEYLSEPGTGAAGGMGLAMRHAFPDSAFVPGYELVSRLLQISAKMADVQCLVTGEGRLDASSLDGKGPIALLREFGDKRSVHFLAGSVDADVAGQLLRTYPKLRIHLLSDPQWPLAEALQRTPERIKTVLQSIFQA